MTWRMTARILKVLEKCELAIVFAEANDKQDALFFMD